MSAATESKIWQALKAGATSRLAAYSNVDWPQDSFEKPQRDNALLEYVEVRHLPAGVMWRPINSSGKQQRGGILQITLVWPAEQVGSDKVVHPDNLIQKAGVIADSFATDARLRFEDVAVRVVEQPTVAQPLRDGVYWRVPISINYSCFC